MRQSSIKTIALVAVDKNMGIGINNILPWKLPADLEHFKKTTNGSAIIMGRKTYESIGRPLPDRMNIVVSRKSLTYTERGELPGNVVYTDSIDKAIKLARPFADNADKKAVYIIGGAEIYKAAQPHIDRWIVSHVLGTYQCDTFLEGFLDGRMRNDTPTVQHSQFWIAEYE